ncbi:MAG: hypothetical protein ACTTIC_02375 [Helicobacteraceae bacterium]
MGAVVASAGTAAKTGANAEAKILFALADAAQADMWRDDEPLRAKIYALSQYELPAQDLRRFSGLILTLYSDQYLLESLSARLENFLHQGGHIFFSGHIFRKFLPALRIYEPLANIKLPDFRPSLLENHTIYNGLDMQTYYKRRGVAGFFARGANPMPRAARAVAAIKNAKLVTDWELEVGAGRIFVHSGNEPYTCASSPRDNLQALRNITNWLAGDE